MDSGASSVSPAAAGEIQTSPCIMWLRAEDKNMEKVPRWGGGYWNGCLAGERAGKGMRQSGSLIMHDVWGKAGKNGKLTN